MITKFHKRTQVTIYRHKLDKARISITPIPNRYTRPSTTSRPSKLTKTNENTMKLRLQGIILEGKVPIVNPTLGNTMLIQHVSSEIICPLDPLSSDTHTPFNWTIYTIIVVLCTVVLVEGLLCLKGFRPRAIRGLASKSSWGASMRAAVRVMQYKLV